MKYYVKESEETFDDIDEVLDACIDEYYHEDDDYFEEWVNDVYPMITVGPYEYSPYEVLDAMNDLDGIKNDFMESQNENDRDNAYWELEHGNVGDEIYIQAYTIEIIDEESGDYDGDEDVDYVEMTRRYYDEQSSLLKYQEEEEKKTEKDMMDLFQRIGA